MEISQEGIGMSLLPSVDLVEETKLYPSSSYCTSICSFCSSTSTGLLKCAGCQKVSYCCKDHQKSDWKQHKKDCFPAIVCNNDILGRHLVATKDFEPTELILREEPIIAGPNIAEEDLPVCLCCYSLVYSGYTCSMCLWSVCNPICEKDNRHAEFECPILTSKRISPFHATGNDITILRCLLLKNKCFKKYEQLMNLESHVEQRKNNSNSQTCSAASLAFIQNVCQLEQFTSEEIDYVTGIIDVNGLGSDDRQGAILYRYGSYLYWNGSMVSHSCVPNAYRIINQNSELEVYASVPIKQGQVISTLYYESILGTQERYEFLQDFYYFSCSCLRCSDPTEFSTMLQGIRCQTCRNDMKDDYLLPVNGKDIHSSWKCKCCGDVKEVEFITCIKNDFKKEIGTIGLESDMDNIGKLEAILAKYRNTIFHPNNFLLVQVEYDIVQRSSLLLYKTRITRVNKAFIERYMELTMKLLSLYDILLPGFNRHRGRVLYFHQQGLLCWIKMRVRCPGTERKQKIIEKFQEFTKIREECRKIFSIENQGSEESMLARVIADNAQEIEALRVLLQ